MQRERKRRKETNEEGDGGAPRFRRASEARPGKAVRHSGSAMAAEVSPLLIITAWRASEASEERLSGIHHRDEWPRCQ